PGADHRRSERGRLLRRAALAVDRRRRDFHRKPLREPGDARDVERLLADLRDAAADHLADLARIDLRPLDRSALHGAEQVRGVESRESPAALPDRATNGFYDVDLAHDRLLCCSAWTPRSARAAVELAGAALPGSERSHRARAMQLSPPHEI